MRNCYLKAGLILGILMIIFSAASAAIGGGFQILEHNSSSSLDGQTIWVKSNSTTPFSITFTNYENSSNNITQIRIETLHPGVRLENIFCPDGWYDDSPSNTSILCKSNTSVLQSNNSVLINATINSVESTNNKETLWTWTTADNSTVNATNSREFLINIDVTPPELNITWPEQDTFHKGDIEINFTANETEVELNLTSFVLESNCSTIGDLNYTTIKVCNNVTNDTNPTFCNFTLILDSKSNISEGYCSFNISINDTLQNQGSAEINLTIDNTPPDITITAPANGTDFYKSATITIKADVSDAIAGINATKCNVKIGGGPVLQIDYNSIDNNTGTCEGTVSAPSVIETYTLEVTVNDSLGNQNSSSIQINVINKPSGGGGGVFMPATRINQPPSVSEPRVSPEAPFENDTLTCVSGRYADPEGTEMGVQEWRWYVNGEQVQADTQIINLAELTVIAGDEITCEQRVSDGERYSNWINSSNKAVVQEREPEPVEIIEAPVVEQVQEEQPATGGITGAFIGALGSSGIGGTILFIGILSLLGTYVFIRYFGKRPKRFILR